jgi:tetratricopeptide (TPR) repeat protein
MRRTLLILCLAVALTSGASGIAKAQVSSQALQSLLADAAAAQARRDFSGAADAFRKATQLDPSIPELWANLGLMDHEIGKSAEAISSFQHAVRLNPSLFVPQLFLGIEYLNAKNPAVALPYLETAEKLRPGDLQAALSLGNAYELLDRADRATEVYSRATEISPNNGNAWLDLGTSYLQQVENDARMMTSAYRSSAYVELRAAETLADEGSLNAAENWYKEAIASASPPPCAHAEFGITLLRLKKVGVAERQFQLEEQTASHCGLAPLGMAISAVAQGHPDIGLKALAALSAADPDFVPSALPLFQGALAPDQVRSLVDLARRQQNAGDHPIDLGSVIDSALAFGGSSASAPPGEDSAYQSPRASAPEKTAQLYAAGQYTRCAHSLNPSGARLTADQQRLLAACSFYSGDFLTVSKAAARLRTNLATRLEGLYWESKADEKLAVAALARADEIEPDSPRMHVLIGDVFRQKRHWSEAEAEYRKAIDIDPKSRAARLSFAIVLFTEQKTDEASAIDKSLLEEVPDDPEANLLAADILVQKHEFQQAEPFLSRCQNLKIDLVPRYHVLLGQVYAATGSVPAAISQYKLGLTSDQDGSIHYQLARLYQKIGDKTNAEEEIQISKEIRERWDEQALIDLGQSPAASNRQ